MHVINVLLFLVYEAKKAIAAVARSIFLKSISLDKSGIMMPDDLLLDTNAYKHCKNLFWYIKLGACVGYQVDKELVRNYRLFFYF